MGCSLANPNSDSVLIWVILALIGGLKPACAKNRFGSFGQINPIAQLCVMDVCRVSIGDTAGENGFCGRNRSICPSVWFFTSGKQEVTCVSNKPFSQLTRTNNFRFDKLVVVHIFHWRLNPSNRIQCGGSPEVLEFITNRKCRESIFRSSRPRYLSVHSHPWPFASLNFGQRLSAYKVLPNDSCPCACGNKNAETGQDDSPQLKTGKWFAFPLLYLDIGSVGVFCRFFLTHFHRCDWRLALGLLCIAASICIFLYGLNRFFVHTFITLAEQFSLTSRMRHVS
jgi:hypothetical protein